MGMGSECTASGNGQGHHRQQKHIMDRHRLSVHIIPRLNSSSKLPSADSPTYSNEAENVSDREAASNSMLESYTKSSVVTDSSLSWEMESERANGDGQSAIPSMEGMYGICKRENITVHHTKVCQSTPCISAASHCGVGTLADKACSVKRE